MIFALSVMGYLVSYVIMPCYLSRSEMKCTAQVRYGSSDYLQICNIHSGEKAMWAYLSSFNYSPYREIGACDL